MSSSIYFFQQHSFHALTTSQVHGSVSSNDTPCDLLLPTTLNLRSYYNTSTRFGFKQWYSLQSLQWNNSTTYRDGLNESRELSSIDLTNFDATFSCARWVLSFSLLTVGVTKRKTEGTKISMKLDQEIMEWLKWVTLFLRCLPPDFQMILSLFPFSPSRHRIKLA